VLFSLACLLKIASRTALIQPSTADMQWLDID